jgi:hypothetical protein
MLNDVIKFVDESFGSKRPRFWQTIYWLEKLEPNANEDMKIAAYSHDIERAFSGPDLELYKNGLSMIDTDSKNKHQIKSGKIIQDFLNKKGYNKKNIKNVFDMVSNHEDGGDKNANLIMNADSISYLETIAKRHIDWINEGIDANNVKIKIDKMFNRINSDVAKKFAKPFYDDCIKYFNKVVKKNAT